jgi:2-amino-4-hydroxy-6-hydroxymethyldihydropteridine diphosphokinase
MKIFQYTLAFGGNVGDVKSEIIRAYDALAKISVKPLCVSGFYLTEPHGPEGQTDYLNSVAGLESTLAPEKLLHYCKGLELLAGRRKSVHWGAREIDIDLLTCSEYNQTGGRLKVPHPYLTDRQFVLFPLWELLEEDFVKGFSQNPQEMLHLCIAKHGLEKISRII